MGASQSFVKPVDTPSADGARDLPPEIARAGGWRKMAMVGLAVLTVLGFAGRVVLSWCSFGSDDARSWGGFGALFWLGPFRAYSLDPTLNHPPLPLIWSGVALAVSALTRLEISFPFPIVFRVAHILGMPGVMRLNVSFPFVFRLAPIAADVGSCIVLYRIWKRRAREGGGDALWAWLAAAAFASNLCAIMDGAFHCNTDNICAFFTLLAAYQLRERRNFFLGGLSMAAAVNVKLVPVMLIPVFFSLCRNWADARRFVLGLSIGVIPFAVMICGTPYDFVRNVLCYTPVESEWGLMLLLMHSYKIPLIGNHGAAATEWYHVYGKYPMLAIAAGLGVMSWWFRRWDAYQIGTIAWCAFLMLTPGFGLQYTVYVAPLLMASRLGRGALYGLVAGLYLLTAYAGAWRGTLPLDSAYDGSFHPNPIPLYWGFLAWGLVIGFFASTVWRGFFPTPALGANLRDGAT